MYRTALQRIELAVAGAAKAGVVGNGAADTLDTDAKAVDLSGLQARAIIIDQRGEGEKVQFGNSRCSIWIFKRLVSPMLLRLLEVSVTQG